jgi:hypothetical protein
VTGGVLAIAETVEQAEQAARRYPQATIVALTAAVDAWREWVDRADPTIEDILDERMLGGMGAGLTDVVEALSERVGALSAGILDELDPHRDLTLRGFFHHLRTNLDGLVIRAEQACAAVDRYRPGKVLIFDDGPWRMSGLSCLDKPVLGVTQHLLKRLAQGRGIEVETVPVQGKDSVAGPAAGASPNATPHVATPAGNSAHMGLARRIVGRLRRELARLGRRSGALRQSRSRAAEVSDIPAASPASIDVPAGLPHLVLALFVDLGPEIGELWRMQGGTVISPYDIPGESATESRLADVQARCRALWPVVRDDREVCRLLHHRGIDLREEMFQQIETILCERFPALWADGRRYDAWLGKHDAVVLFGGLIDTHYVLGRVAARHGVPVVSYHNGGFHGFSLIPIHERYDRAECDYFICGGPIARDTFAVPPEEARWRREVRRARPVPLGAPWIADLVRRERCEPPVARPVRRVMVVLNALLGDCRYLGRVFPPEIAYWHFCRRLIERLGREPIEIIVKPPLLARYPQQRNPVEDWLAERHYPNVSILREVPLADCLDQADAFLLESPSTPLPHVVATRAALLLYVDRHVYRLVPAARELLRRRCAVLGESEEEFFAALEGWLADVRSGRAKSGGGVDDGFLENVCTGSGPPSSAGRMVSFLKDVYAAHPLDDADVITAERWIPRQATGPEAQVV